MESTGIAMEVDSASKRNRLIAGLVMIGLATGLGLLVSRWGFWPGLGAFIFGVSGISLVAASFKFAGRAPCPHCGKQVDALSATSDAHACGGCGAYLRCIDKKLFPTPPDHVSSSAVYSLAEIEPGHQPDLPALCPECGAPSTRHLPREVIKSVGIPGTASVIKKWTIQLPYCASHSAGVTSFGGRISVKSHKFWLECRSGAEMGTRSGVAST